MSTAAPSGLRWLAPRPSPSLAEQAPHDALARVAWEGRCIKDEEETWVGADATHHWKLYRVPLRRRLFASLVRSRSRREWNALRCAEQAGLPVVPPAGCAESRSGPILTSSLLVVESVEAEDVRRLFENPEHPRTLRLRWAQALGQAIRAFHEAGFVHFRMQLRNLLLTEPDNNPDVVWLDLPYTQKFSKLPPRWLRVVDLVDLCGPHGALSQEEAEEVLLAYAGGGTLPIGLHGLRNRSPFHQKVKRILGYLLSLWTGHAPRPPS